MSPSPNTRWCPHCGRPTPHAPLPQIASDGEMIGQLSSSADPRGFFRRYYCLECRAIWREYPNHRIRFKHIGGGGGKGQRVVARPEQVKAAVMDVLAESKVLPPGSNRNFLIELNLESTRHNEIQLIGNGRWCVSLGGRDCSV